MKKCPKCGSTGIKKSGMINKEIMSKTGKKLRKIQSYRCESEHFFQVKNTSSYTNSFVELVVFVYLNSHSLNVTINIVRAIYDSTILSKAIILSFLENTADEVLDIDSIDNIFHPKRSGYLAVDGVWFKFRGRDIVMLVYFDPETFDIIEVDWSLQEDEKAYTKLLTKVTKKMGFENIRGIYGDGDKGLMRTLKTHLPLIPFQLCIVHKEMRMGQLVPVKLVNVSKRMSKESLLCLKVLKEYFDKSNQPRFEKAYRSLRHNFKYSLTHFNHPGMMRDNNMIECFNGIIKPRLRLMKGFKKYENLNRYLKLFILNYRFHPLRESRFEERRGLNPLQVAEVNLPQFNNFLSFLRKSLKLNFLSN